MKFELEQYDIVEAIFKPKRTDNLIEGAAELIGKKSVWKAVRIIEDGEYTGDWAMAVCKNGCPFAWAPERDLEITMIIYQPGATQRGEQ